MKTYIAAKIHGVHVTDKSVSYHGSISVGRALMEAAGIEEFEQVQVVNLRNGERWVTYAIAHEEDQACTLNGGSALLGEIGDRCILMTYVTSDAFSPAHVIFCDENNHITGHQEYLQKSDSAVALDSAYR